jgi:hypothetical protein
MFSKEDLKLFKQKGISAEMVTSQIEQFRAGFPYISLERPATPGDGIQVLEAKKTQDLARYYDENRNRYSLLKFVPASGAATRMFKHLHHFLSAYASAEEKEKALQQDKSPDSVFAVLRNLTSFAFFEDLKEAMKQDGKEVRQLLEKKDYHTILHYLMETEGLNYADLPKGLIKFHKYQSYSRTAMEEHLVEGTYYVRQEDGKVPLHFTISPEHEKAFRARLDKVKPVYEQRYGVRFDIDFSFQKTSTDTVAVTLDNEPLRDEHNRIVFRPGGHGALLDNLSECGADIIFIKNIDNVVPDRLKQETYLYKKVLGGYLLQLRRKVNDYLRSLEAGNMDEGYLEEIHRFAIDELHFDFPEDFHFRTQQEKANLLFGLLHRPIRACGMVRNEGEPGGGPFWVRNKEGRRSLQIVESSQINLQDAEQKEIFSRATHFNPVDLVCSVSDYKGEYFDLKAFRDPETGFISEKSVSGQRIKALELPGLWNGAMAHWITVFVEVPIITFNPVKTLNDLLRKEHQ